jgi:uncharacterized membrane protein
MSDELHQEQIPAGTPSSSPEVKSEHPKAVMTIGPERAKQLAVLSYFGMLLLVPLLIARDNEYIQFHLKQGIVWFVAWVLVSFLFAIPLIGWSLAIAALAISVYAAVQAYEGKRWEMPVLGKYAKMIKL